MIGALADTHDNLPKIEKAVRFFNAKKASFVLHAGDFVSPFTIPKLKNLKCPWQGVFGNNDGERRGLTNASLGAIREGPLTVELAGRSIVLVHDKSSIDTAGLKADVFIFGHTHTSHTGREGGMLVVNPGECSGWLTGKASVALIDLDNLSARIFRI